MAWKFANQIIITHFTMEYKFITLKMVSMEAYWLRNFPMDIPLWAKLTPLMSMHYNSQTIIT